MVATVVTVNVAATPTASLMASPTGTSTSTASAAPSLTPAPTGTPRPTATQKPTPVVTPATTQSAATAAPPLALAAGPHLFLDNYLIAYRDNVTRHVVTPARTRPNPLITGLLKPNGDANVNFATVVLRDPQTGLFRLWYTAYDVTTLQRYSAYITSPDGLHWLRPAVEVTGTRDAPISDVIDLGPHAADPSQRFQALTSSDVAPIWLPSRLVSPDGLTWRVPTPNISSPAAFGEIWRVFQELGAGGFGLLHRWNRPFSWTDAGGVKHVNTVQDPGFVRLFALSSSADLTQVSNTQIIFAPDSHDSGETQFYSMSNVLHRGDYYLATLDVLRNDLTATGVPLTVTWPALGQQLAVYGTGYTVLAWSRDGQHWFRDRETDPFFSPSPEVGSWDHAVAWVNSLVENGDKVYLYYGGYQYGHKVSFDRQIGLVTTYRDRFVGQLAGQTPGTLRTPRLTFQAASLTLNADVGNGGRIRVEVLGDDGLPLPGFGFDNCTPVVYNSLVAPVQCAQSFATLANRPVQLQFELTNAQLFAFNLGASN